MIEALLLKAWDKWSANLPRTRAAVRDATDPVNRFLAERMAAGQSRDEACAAIIRRVVAVLSADERPAGV